MPDNPITEKAGPAGNPIAITIEVFQAAFIGFTAAIINYEHRKKKKGQQEVEKSITRASGKRHMPILGGIVIALILAFTRNLCLGSTVLVDEDDIYLHLTLI